MCSIYAILNSGAQPRERRNLAARQSHLLHHRGPDSSGICEIGKNVLCHNRIAVVDVFNGGQPIRSQDGRAAVIANAEIYNHAALRQSCSAFPFRTASDCEVILPVLEREGARGIDRLRGMFAFVAVFDGGERFVIGRDHIGILSLYYGYDQEGALHVSSELKALEGVCVSYSVFPPGHYLTETDPAPVRYYFPPWSDATPTLAPDSDDLRQALTASVRRHLMADVNVGFLLSGGLDSSLIASIGTRLLREQAPSADIASYSIGLADSPDLEAARDVADFLGLRHNQQVFTVEEGLDALEQTIYHLESCDVTSVRASVPMYMLSRRIRGDGTKVVLTGDGADESFAGYLYFHFAPDDDSIHQECTRKLEMMHLYDCLRANKTMLAWGVEPRVPFLDRDFLEFAMGIAPRLKRCSSDRMEKHALREAFRTYLPDRVLWRQKEQSSDGVGYGWIDGLKAYAQSVVSDAQLERAPRDFPKNPPRTKEALLYRTIFAGLFGSDSAADCVPQGKSSGNATAISMTWMGDKAIDDPSGRAVRGVHNAAVAG